MMEDVIKNFTSQFSFFPEIINEKKLGKFRKFIVCGMGGSHLAAGILRDSFPDIKLTIHSDYGLPVISDEDLEDSLVILSSYSGNTEEVIDSLEQAMVKKMSVAVIAVGGKLIKFAKDRWLPYIELPDTGIQPRSALGYSLIALLKMLDRNDLIEKIKLLEKIISVKPLRKEGQGFANQLNGFVPVIYSSRENLSVAYNWKIKMNETGKIPAFYNIVPELNHNEMTGFDVKSSSKSLSDKFYFIFITDPGDLERIKKRFEVLTGLYKDRGLPVVIKEMHGKTKLEKIFNSLILADWTALYTARNYGLEAEQVPMVEEFKKLIKE